MRVFFLLFSAALLFASCEFLDRESINGNGKIATRERNVGAFNSIEANGAFEVHVQQASANSVKVETDENLMEYIDVYTEGSTLILRPKKGFSLDPSKEITVYASAPEFKDLEVNGASKIIGDGPLSGNDLELHATGASELTMEVKTAKLKAELSGASHLNLKGSSSTVSTEASGASHVKCMDLVTDETTLHLSGASSAEVNADKQLTIEASGASNVKYRGNANINQKSNGASSVEKVS